MQDAYQWAAAAVERIAQGRALLPVSDVCPGILPLQYQTVRNKISNGSFPLPVLKLGSKNFIRTHDLVIFLAGTRLDVQEPAPEPGLSSSRRPGRPRKNARGVS